MNRSVAFYDAILDTLAAVLIVDEEGRVLYANEPWYDMVDVERSIVDFRITPELRERWSAMLRNPEGFSARLEELREHPELEAHDLIEFKDGRLFERYSKPIPNENYKNVRLWVFRNFSDRLAMHDALPSIALSQRGANRIAERIATLEYELARARVLRAHADVATEKKAEWLDTLLGTAHKVLGELLSDQPRGAGSLEAGEIRDRGAAAFDVAIHGYAVFRFDELCSIADVASVPVFSPTAFLEGFVPALCAHTLMLNKRHSGMRNTEPAIRLFVAGGSVVIESVGDMPPPGASAAVTGGATGDPLDPLRPKLRVITELEDIFATLSGFHRAETRTAREWIRYEHD